LAFLVIRQIKETNYDDENMVYVSNLKAGELEAGGSVDAKLGGTDTSSNEKGSIEAGP